MIVLKSIALTKVEVVEVLNALLTEMKLSEAGSSARFYLADIILKIEGQTGVTLADDVRYSVGEIEQLEGATRHKGVIK